MTDVDLRRLKTFIVGARDDPKRVAHMESLCRRLGLDWEFAGGIRCRPAAIGCNISHLRAYLRARRRLPAQAQEPTRPETGAATGDQGGTAAADARADRGPGAVVAAGGDGLLPLPRRAHQLSCPERLSPPHHGALEALAPAARPARPNDWGADGASRRPLAPEAAHPPPLARKPLRRQPPEVAARCPNWARRDLCGGRPVMGIPTAIRDFFETRSGRCSAPCWETTRRFRLRASVSLCLCGSSSGRSCNDS